MLRACVVMVGMVVGLWIGAAPGAQAAACPWMKPSLSANARAQMLLGAMSLSEKIAMTYQQYPLDYHYGTAGWIPANPSLCIPDLAFNDAGRNWEYMGEDPFLAGQGATAKVRGIQSQHVIVTLKHYIANSQETNREATGAADSADVGLPPLEEIHAPQYDVAIHRGDPQLGSMAGGD